MEKTVEKEAVMQYSDALQHFHVALLLTEIHIFGFKFKIYIYISAVGYLAS